MNRLYVIIPAYNEQANIMSVIDQWYPVVETHGEDSRLVIIDDGSKDATYALACKAAETRPGLVALTKPNQGHGATILYGYRLALEQGADFIFQTDSDQQTDPDEFEAFWDMHDEFDMVIGNRVDRGDGTSRAFVSHTLRYVVKQKFNVWVEDANTPFRIMNAAALADCMHFIPDDFNLANVAILAAFLKLGYSVHYLPITFHARKGGKNSINLGSIVGIGKKALDDFTRIDKELDAEAARRRTL